MPRAKKPPRSQSTKREPAEIPPLAVWFIREILPLLRQRHRPKMTESREHLKNAGIEVLQAMRACIDETIEWLQKEEESEPMKRIEVED